MKTSPFSRRTCLDSYDACQGMRQHISLLLRIAGRRSWTTNRMDGRAYAHTRKLCPVKVLGQHFLHLRLHGNTGKTFFSSYWTKGAKSDVTAENISRALKSAGTELQYHTNKGIPISRINTHSLRSGGANALALVRYSDTQIQKMGRWRGATFKEYGSIRSAKQDDIYGASNIVLPCPSS
jgi:hypothetical protein